MLVTSERFLRLTDLCILVIICLTRQPIRKVKTSRSGENKQLSKAAYPVKDKAALLIFQIQNSDNQKTNGQDYHKFFICTHKHPPFRQDSERVHSRPIGCLGKHIILSRCKLLLILYFGSVIIYLTGQPEGKHHFPVPAKFHTKLRRIAVPKL